MRGAPRTVRGRGGAGSSSPENWVILILVLPFPCFPSARHRASAPERPERPEPHPEKEGRCKAALRPARPGLSGTAVCGARHRPTTTRRATRPERRQPERGLQPAQPRSRVAASTRMPSPTSCPSPGRGCPPCRQSAGGGRRALPGALRAARGLGASGQASGPASLTPRAQGCEGLKLRREPRRHVAAPCSHRGPLASAATARPTLYVA